VNSAACNRFFTIDNIENLLFDADKQSEEFMRRAINKFCHEILKNALRNWYYEQRYEIGIKAQNKYLSSGEQGENMT
jgi:hypothetical protein